jgi:hypothetical protein
MNTCNDEATLNQNAFPMVDMLFGDVFLDGLFDELADDVGGWMACAGACGEQQPTYLAAAGNR